MFSKVDHQTKCYVVGKLYITLCPGESISEDCYQTNHIHKKVVITNSIKSPPPPRDNKIHPMLHCEITINVDISDQ